MGVLDAYERARLEHTYDLGKEARVEPVSREFSHDEERFAIGWDIALADGKPVIIEYHVGNTFGTKGFKAAGREGAIDFSEYQGGEHGDFYDFTEGYTEKDAAHDLIGDHMTALLDPEDLEQYDDDDIVVTKPAKGARGRGVRPRRVGDIDVAELSERTVIEEIVDGDPVTVTYGPVSHTANRIFGDLRQMPEGLAVMVGGFGAGILIGEPTGAGIALGSGAAGTYMVINPILQMSNLSPTQRLCRAADTILESYDIKLEDERKACMRYVTGVSIDEDGMDIEDFGGYWRTAAAPDEEDAPMEDRYVANLSSGKPTEATDEELAAAFRIGVEGLSTMYNEWLRRHTDCGACDTHACTLMDLGDDLTAALDDHAIDPELAADLEDGVEAMATYFNEHSDIEPGVTLVSP